MADLLQKNTRKSDWQIAEEARIAKARAAHASFGKSFADLADNTVETGPRAVAFITSLGGASNMPEVAAQRTAQKADALDALPVNVKAAAKRFDDGTQKFVAALYARHKADGKAVSFTATDAGKLMGKEPETARKSVEALTTAGIIKPAYNSMGGLAGYLPAILD